MRWRWRLVERWGGAAAEPEGLGRRRLVAAAVLAALAGCVTGPAGGVSGSAGPAHALAGVSPSPQEAPSLAGELVALPAPGHVTVVDFWATWCKPCFEAIPELKALWRRHRARGLRVVGVATDDNPGMVVAAVERLGVSYPIALDHRGRTSTAVRLGSCDCFVAPTSQSCPAIGYVGIEQAGQAEARAAGPKPRRVRDRLVA